MEALAIGDLHFDGPLMTLMPDHHLAIGRELDRISEYARTKGIKRIIQLGDVGHKPRISYESQMEYLRWIRDSADLKIDQILGNHDLFTEDPADGHSMQLVEIAAPPNYRLHKYPKAVKIDGLPVFFMPWPCRDFRKNSLNIFHLEADGTTGDNGRPSRAPKGTKLVKTKAWALGGHLHTKQKVRNMYYPGTPYQTCFGEQEEKWLSLISGSSLEDLEITFVPHVPEFILRTVHIESAEDLKRIPKDPKILVRAVVKDGADVPRTAIAKFPNVVKIRPYRSKAEFETILTEDLHDGQQIKIQTEEFVQAYLDTRLDISPELQAKSWDLHSKLFSEPQ